MTTAVAPAFDATDVQVRLFEIAKDGRYRYIGFGGGIRGTKTWGGLGLLVTLCRIFPRSRWAVVRKDLPTLRRNTLPSFNKMREECFGAFIGEVNQSSWTATCTNGSQLIFFPESLDVDPDLSRWKGLEVNGFLLEEADELAERSFHKAIERSGTWIIPHGGAQPPPYVFNTFNPCANWPKHVFYDPWKCGTIAAPYAFIPATQADNPFVPELTREGWKSLPEQEYKRFVEGDWNVLTGRYYDTIDQRVHLVPRDTLPREWPSWWTYWGAFDWGYAHWAVFGAFGQDGDGNALLLDSVWMRREQDEEMARTIIATMPSQCLRPVYAGQDTDAVHRARGASGITTTEVFARFGIATRPADTDKVNGGRAVRRALEFKRDEDGTFLTFPQIRLVDTPGNARVLAQLAEIMPDEDNINKPGKSNADSEGRGGDDGADMFRYGVASHPPLAKQAQVSVPEQDRSPRIDWTNRANPVKREKAADSLERVFAGEAKRQQRSAFRNPWGGK